MRDGPSSNRSEDRVQQLLLILLSSGGPTHIPLADAWPLHRAMISAAQQGLLPWALADLGYRPDPCAGLRADRVDAALLDLANRGLLVSSGFGWRLSRAARAYGRQAMRALGEPDATVAARLAEQWSQLTMEQSRRRRLSAQGAA